MAGRPQHKVEINLNSPEESVGRILELCRNENLLKKVKEFSLRLHSKICPSKNSATQTDNLVFDESTQTDFTTLQSTT